MPHTRRNIPFHRPAFAMNGWLMFLFLLFIGLCVWNAYLVWQAMPRYSGAYGAGSRLGVWFAPVVVPIVVLAVAWCVGKLVSLMFGKSDDAGNIGAAVVMLGAISLYGYGIYGRFAAPVPSAPQQVAAAQPGAPTPRAAISSPPPDARATPPAPTPIPAQPHAAAPAASPADPPSAPPAAATPPPSPRALPAPPAANENSAARPIIDAFAADLGKSIDALVAHANKLLPDLARQPAHDLTKIKARRADAAALRTEAAAVKAALDAASDQLTAKLENAGISASDARSAAFKWSGFEYKTAPRGFGADALIRLADKAEEECAYITDNFGKWTLDSKGEVKSSDFQMKAKIGSLHFFVKAEADRRQFITDQLQGR